MHGQYPKLIELLVTSSKMNRLGRLQAMKGFLPASVSILKLASLCFCLAIVPSRAQTVGAPYSGMVWSRHGGWFINGSSSELRIGEAVAPGSLITGDAREAAHSLVILMPDGQHLLCECFNGKTCSQGFRIPAITPIPAPAVWKIFVDVRNTLLLRLPTAEAAFPLVTGKEALAGNLELVAAVTPTDEISLSSALRKLPFDHYTLSVSKDDGVETPATTQTLDWLASRPVAPVRVEGVGAYRIRIFDQTKTLRIEIELLATPATALDTEVAGLAMVRKTILQWSTVHPGWSLHDFLRVYLQSRAIALAAS
jgi:hypothetical protein